MSFFREYYENIKIVDDGIQNMTSLIEEYFNHDGKTSYILTSDHGMTDWGKQCYTSYLLLMRVTVDVWSNIIDWQRNWLDIRTAYCLSVFRIPYLV